MPGALIGAAVAGLAGAAGAVGTAAFGAGLSALTWSALGSAFAIGFVGAAELPGEQRQLKCDFP